MCRHFRKRIDHMPRTAFIQLCVGREAERVKNTQKMWICTAQQKLLQRDDEEKRKCSWIYSLHVPQVLSPLTCYIWQLWHRVHTSWHSHSPLHCWRPQTPSTYDLARTPEVLRCHSDRNQVHLPRTLHTGAFWSPRCHRHPRDDSYWGRGDRFWSCSTI